MHHPDHPDSDADLIDDAEYAMCLAEAEYSCDV